jgi:hypothetical protein
MDLGLLVKDRPKWELFSYDWKCAARPGMVVTPTGTVSLGNLQLLRATSRTSSGVDSAFLELRQPL